MNDKMKQHAARIRQAETEKQEALAEIVSQVRDGLLTREEAAKCVAGAMLKIADEQDLPGAAGLGYAQLLVDQALDGEDFEGLVTGRHTQMDILIRSIPKEVVAQLDSIKGQLSREEFLRRKLAEIAEIGEVPQVQQGQGLRGFTDDLSSHGGRIRLVAYAASIGGSAQNLTPEQFNAYQHAKLVADPRNEGNWQRAKEILEAAGLEVYWD